MCERPPPSLSMTAAAPNRLGRACRPWSVCVCRRPRELLRQPQRRSGDSRRAASCTAARRETPQGNELKAPFGELVVTGRRKKAARAGRGPTLARSYGHFDALLVGTEVGVLVDKTPETMAAV